MWRIENLISLYYDSLLKQTLKKTDPRCHGSLESLPLPSIGVPTVNRVRNLYKLLLFGPSNLGRIFHSPVLTICDVLMKVVLYYLGTQSTKGTEKNKFRVILLQVNQEVKHKLLRSQVHLDIRTGRSPTLDVGPEQAYWLLDLVTRLTTDGNYTIPPPSEVEWTRWTWLYIWRCHALSDTYRSPFWFRRSPRLLSDFPSKALCHPYHLLLIWTSSFFDPKFRDGEVNLRS